MKMEWLTNWKPDNDRPAALQKLTDGVPKASDRHSESELSAMGFVGLYRPEITSVRGWKYQHPTTGGIIQKDFNITGNDGEPCHRVHDTSTGEMFTLSDQELSLYQRIR